MRNAFCCFLLFQVMVKSVFGGWLSAPLGARVSSQHEQHTPAQKGDSRGVKIAGSKRKEGACFPSALAEGGRGRGSVWQSRALGRRSRGSGRGAHLPRPSWGGSGTWSNGASAIYSAWFCGCAGRTTLLYVEFDSILRKTPSQASKNLQIHQHDGKARSVLPLMPWIWRIPNTSDQFCLAVSGGGLHPAQSSQGFRIHLPQLESKNKSGLSANTMTPALMPVFRPTHFIRFRVLTERQDPACCTGSCRSSTQ